ncbi:MAG: DUF4835 family protein [Ignavibacteria bacterium]|nr:DUF4835 family protein [Ignavibacteria bacterium]
MLLVQRSIRRTLLLIAGVSWTLLSSLPNASAQELRCDVTINIDNIPSAQRDYLRNFEADVEQFLNGYRWTTEDLGGEKIDCAMTISFTGATSDYRYTAKVFVGSRRPVYIGNERSPRETLVLRILDEQWEFEYVPNRPLYHDEYRFDPLASFLAYYAYLIVGFDLETYVELSGTKYFQKALSICNQGSSSAFGKDWKQQSGGSYSKFSFAEELVDLRNQQFRLAFHSYHFNGVDLLATELSTGMENMLQAAESMAEMRQRLNPRSLLVKTFFDTKYLEIAETFLQYPNRSVYDRISKADPSHQGTYTDYSRR